jgi:pimeloyl-ACP methyl ester carboxylesterase
MSNHESIKIYVVIPLFISFAFLFIILGTAILISNSGKFGTTSLVYGQQDRMNLNTANSLNIQNIPAKKVHVGDIDIAYKMFGKGDPFLLISGSGLVMDAWEPSILKELLRNHTVIIFDNRGVGNTTTGSKPYSIQQFANDTAGLMDALKIQKADVLGFSMASFIAQEITLLHPEKVNRLILYGATCGGEGNISQSPQVVKILSDLVNNRTQDPEKILSVTFPLEWVKSHPNIAIPKSKEIVTSNTLKQQFNLNEGWLATNWSGVCSQLTKISKPTLIITGTEDVAVPAANSLILAQKIPGAWLIQIKGGGHGLMYQYPDIFNKVLQTFLLTTTNPS